MDAYPTGSYHTGSYHTIETPRSSPGAIGIVRVVHDDVGKLGLVNPVMGALRLGDLLGIDEGVVARWDADSVVLMAHGGIAILRAISQRLEEMGVAHRDEIEPTEMYPEADSEIEAWMLFALSQAASPAAIDLLLNQPGRWKALGVERIEDARKVSQVADSQSLDRLINAPIVAAVGRANIGKSTLINALAGKHVAIVADVAGTTRDHVGVLVDLGGVVVRWIDTPGIDERVVGGEEGDEIDIALRVVSQAQLIVHCVDSVDDAGVLDERVESAIGADVTRVRVGMRADLGEHACSLDVQVSIGNGVQNGGHNEGVGSLVETIREALVPTAICEDSRPWRFWEAAKGDASR